MSGPTPGPWQIEGQARGGLLISAGINEYRDGPAAYVAALLPHSESAKAVKPADVALILLAPTLFDIAQDAVPILEVVLEEREEEIGEEDEVLRDLIDRFRSAIAKAGGQ